MNELFQLISFSKWMSTFNTQKGIVKQVNRIMFTFLTQTRKFTLMNNILTTLVIFLLCIGNLYSQEKNTYLVIDAKGHSSLVRKVAFTSNNQNIISVSEDKTIRVWDLKSNALIKTLWGQHTEGKEGRYNALALAPNSSIVAVGGFLENNEIRIIDLRSGKQIASLLGHENVITDLKFSSDGQWLASASADKTAKIWYIPELGEEGFNDEPYEKLTINDHSDIVYNIDFSEDKTKLVTCSFDGSVKLYSMAVAMSNASLVKVWETNSKFTNVDISNDNQYVVAGQTNGKVIVWNTNGTEVATLSDTKGFISSLNFSEDGEKLMVTDAKGNVYFYSTDVWLKRDTFNVKDRLITAAAFANKSSEYAVIATGSEGNIKLWDLKKKKIIRDFKGEGISNKRIGRSDKLNFSLSITPKNKQPYNKTFDFETLTMGLQKPTQTDFKMSEIQQNGLLLKKLNAYALQCGTTQIQNDKNRDKGINAYCFTPSDDIVVASGGSLKLYSNTGNLIRSFKGHSGSVTTANVSKEGKYLISSSTDQTTKIWNLQTGELLASLFVSTSNDWVCWSPHGYYHASAGGEKYIGWLKNNGVGNLATYYPVSFASKEFHKKDILIKIIQLGSFEAAQKEMMFTTVALSNVVAQQPKINWISPTFTNNVHEIGGHAKIEAKVESSSKLKSLKLLIDGRPTVIPLDDLVQEEGKYIYSINTEVKVEKEEVNFQIFAANTTTKITSDARKVVSGGPVKDSSLDMGFDLEAMFNTAENKASHKTNIYLLAIGVSKYQNSELDLTFADNDAVAIADIYSKQRDGSVFNEVNIKKLTNEEANKSNIVEGFKWLSENATSKDLAIVFIASHGLNYEDNFYIIPHDVKLDDVKNTAVSWSDCSNVMASLPSQVLMYVDACNSGQLGKDITRSDNTESIRQLSSDENGVVIMSGSTGNESSLESPKWQHGAFTAALIDGLGEGKADYSRDNIISLRELDLFIAMKVDELTEGKQHPTTQKPSTISSMTIGVTIGEGN
ncbi:caspase family protein [Flammeovirga sp. OC4]|uniref:caspase family protein n=1 Tax=Flammeovirga sp. OC4 TaxID=1382345 RepID=UPI0009E47CC4|nr:caspase family protein [Flammeovirga sp. OC4]